MYVRNGLLNITARFGMLKEGNLHITLVLPFFFFISPVDSFTQSDFFRRISVNVN